MLKRMAVIFLGLAVFGWGSAHASMQQLKEARKTEESGQFDKALELYETMLKKQQNDTKMVLRIYDRILAIHKLRKDVSRTNDVLSHLKRNYPRGSFDLMDLEKLSVLYSRYGATEEALKLQRKIVNAPYASVNRKGILRTYARLLKHYRESPSKVAELFRGLNLLPESDLDDHDRYACAMLHLKYGERKRAVELLERIVREYPRSVSARKALFVLARDAQKQKDYSSAIGYYSTYIKRYPENTYFVQKAFQRTVDCQLARGEKELSKEDMRRVTDWLNSTSDYRSLLDLARDLKLKGMDPLAETAFDTGYSAAMKLVDEKPGSYEALKAWLEVARSAHYLGRIPMAEKAARAILSDFPDLDDRHDKDTRSIKSQGYLWLARIEKENGQYDSAIKALESFLKLYPDHKDIEYALFELGSAYESKGDSQKARDCYKKVKSEVFKGKITERLNGER